MNNNSKKITLNIGVFIDKLISYLYKRFLSQIEKKILIEKKTKNENEKL